MDIYRNVGEMECSGRIRRGEDKILFDMAIEIRGGVKDKIAEAGH